ncbi:DUF4245 domain-containing protein [Microbacterium sp. SSW1-59]|uniref:DUF4245 domain-containing protein n=1 Tax=Microbacterium xanthum TaxID=3079794 RepID=UPI002AD44944|nr:DUF4245 domain-containing protein [Microbacterium sp. SSW1-59]MDZ8202204.1 DUF4245 domain-containing protein [Microbacterium sp. SSW1-59]
MARPPRVVAELGRPETPGETAERKAASSAAYRSSKTVRNLVVALLVTLGIVAVIILAVPRGDLPATDVDVAETAAKVESGDDADLIVPDLPDTWRVNSALVDAEDAVRAWTIVYVPESGRGYLRVEQGFDADDAWASRVLRGAEIEGTETIDGITWDRYDVSGAGETGNITQGLAAQAGPDVVLIYGDSDEASLRQAAASVADQIRELQEES